MDPIAPKRVRGVAAVVLLTAAAVPGATERAGETTEGPADRAAACAAAIDATSDLDQVEANGQVRFTLTAAAIGDCDLSSVVLTDPLPFVLDGEGHAHPAFTVVALDPPAAATGDSEIVWELGTIPAGGSTAVTMTVAFNEPLAEAHEIVNAACLTAAEVEGTRCDNAVIAVGRVGRPEPNGTPGFWCRQIRGAMDDQTDSEVQLDELAALLIEANNASLVFTALYDTSSVALARSLLCRPEALAGTSDRMARQLMTMWWNVASRRVSEEWRLGDLCPGAKEPPEGTEGAWTVGTVLDEAESALLYGAPDLDLHFLTEVIAFANHAHSPEACSRAGRRPGAAATGEP